MHGKRSEKEMQAKTSLTASAKTAAERKDSRTTGLEAGNPRE